MKQFAKLLIVGLGLTVLLSACDGDYYYENHYPGYVTGYKTTVYQHHPYYAHPVYYQYDYVNTSPSYVYVHHRHHSHRPHYRVPVRRPVRHKPGLTQHHASYPGGGTLVQHHSVVFGGGLQQHHPGSAGRSRVTRRSRVLPTMHSLGQHSLSLHSMGGLQQHHLT